MDENLNRRITNILKKVYFNLNSPSAYAGTEKVYREAKKQIPKLKPHHVKEFLQGESTHTLYRPIRKKFKKL